MKNQNTIQSLQVLRGLAASMVVMVHSFIYLQARGLIPSVPSIVDAGRAGVDIFFVISGFIMICISGDSFTKPGAPVVFLVKRFIRVAPIYWFYTILMALLAYMLPQLVSQGKMISLDHLIASLLFVPWLNSIGDVKPVLGAGWTLNFEMYFYLVFGFLLLFKKIYLLPSLAAILLFGLLLDFLWHPHATVLHVITSPLLIEFLMGCVIGVLYTKNFFINTRVWYALLFTGWGSLVFTGLYEVNGWPRVLIWGLPSALIVASSVWLERSSKISPPLLFVKLGDSSYSLYLSHIFTINVVGKIWVTLFGAFNAVFIIVAFIMSIIVGYLAYWIFEKPITGRLNSVYRNLLLRRAVKAEHLNSSMILKPVNAIEKVD